MTGTQTMMNNILFPSLHGSPLFYQKMIPGYKEFIYITTEFHQKFPNGTRQKISSNDMQGSTMKINPQSAFIVIMNVCD